MLFLDLYSVSSLSWFLGTMKGQGGANRVLTEPQVRGASQEADSCASGKGHGRQVQQRRGSSTGKATSGQAETSPTAVSMHAQTIITHEHGRGSHSTPSPPICV